MATYTDTKFLLREIEKRSVENAKKLTQARALVDSAIADLSAMTSTYSTSAAQIDVDAAANPNAAIWQNALAEKNQILTDFAAIKARAELVVVAVTGL